MAEVGSVVFGMLGTDCSKCSPKGFEDCRFCKGTDPLQTPQVVLLGRILDSLGRIECLLGDLKQSDV